MGEVDLNEIEKRIDQYPPQARSDILRLMGELRRLNEPGAPKQAASAGSHLYDVQTGLLNGGAYGVRFAAARARATRYKKFFAVMSIDLDPGAAREERDRTIMAVAQRLERSVRETDTLARIGDDSFAIILEDLTQAGHAERVKQTVQDALAEPLHLAHRDVVPATRVRLQFYPQAPGEGAGPLLYNS